TVTEPDTCAEAEPARSRPADRSVVAAILRDVMTGSSLSESPPRSCSLRCLHPPPASPCPPRVPAGALTTPRPVIAFPVRAVESLQRCAFLRWIVAARGKGSAARQARRRTRVGAVVESQGPAPRRGHLPPPRGRGEAVGVRRRSTSGTRAYGSR